MPRVGIDPSPPALNARTLSIILTGTDEMFVLDVVYNLTNIGWAAIVIVMLLSIHQMKQTL